MPVCPAWPGGLRLGNIGNEFYLPIDRNRVGIQVYGKAFPVLVVEHDAEPAADAGAPALGDDGVDVVVRLVPRISVAVGLWLGLCFWRCHVGLLSFWLMTKIHVGHGLAPGFTPGGAKNCPARRHGLARPGNFLPRSPVRGPKGKSPKAALKPGAHAPEFCRD